MNMDKKTYVSLYKKNMLPYLLVLLSIIAELIYVVVILDVMNVSYMMGITVMVNIVLLFTLFSCATKISVYHCGWGIAAIGLGGYMLLRMLILVPLVLKPYNRQMLIAGANIVGGVILIVAGFISVKKTLIRQKLQKQLDQQKTS